MLTFDWLKPSPLWQTNGRDLLVPAQRDAFRRPQILEFRSDDFMPAFLGIAERGAAAEFPIATPPPLEAGRPLKLFQPAHGRFYLVCASLCCLQPGFPDRKLDAAQGESAFFVLRKLVSGQEYGWVSEGSGPLGWQPLNGAPLLEGEQRQPLFLTPSGSAALGGARTLAAGYIPVASRETYQAKPAELPGIPETEDARIVELENRFSDHLSDDLAFLSPDLDDDTALLLSVYLLLDLWDYLYDHLPKTAEALKAKSPAGLAGAELDLFNFLKGEALGGSLRLDAALGEAAIARDTLNELGDDPLPVTFRVKSGGVYDYSLKDLTLDTDGLKTAVEAALAAASPTPPGEALVEVPKLRPDTGETFVIRCVYSRPQCLQQKLWVSQPTVAFSMAPFFDPDAPARPLRIQMPDVSLSSLRRAKKGVGFVLPDSLVNRLGGIDDSVVNLLDGQNVALGLGYLCTLSIPIITIVAFILLLVMVIVLNLVFWWIPFFKICLPVPKPSS